MLRTLLLSAGFVACLAGSALADDDVMANFYGNTAIATGGTVDTHATYNADHTFSMRVPSMGLEFKGTWEVKGSNLCRTYESPPPGITNPYCTPVAARKVGDTWTMTGNGQTRTITLVKGVQ